MSSKNSIHTSHKNKTTVVKIPDPPPFVFNASLKSYSSLQISSSLVSDIIEYVHYYHLMKIALLKWPEYAVERMLFDLRITTLAFLRAPDTTPMPIFDDELLEPVSQY